MPCNRSCARTSRMMIVMVVVMMMINMVLGNTALSSLNALFHLTIRSIPRQNHYSGNSSTVMTTIDRHITPNLLISWSLWHFNFFFDVQPKPQVRYDHIGIHHPFLSPTDTQATAVFFPIWPWSHSFDLSHNPQPIQAMLIFFHCHVS